MYMSESEICNQFKYSKNKKKQIQILGELNGCSPDKIKNILYKNGYNDDGSKKSNTDCSENVVLNISMSKESEKYSKLENEFVELSKCVLDYTRDNHGYRLYKLIDNQQVFVSDFVGEKSVIKLAQACIRLGENGITNISIKEI